MSYQTPKRVAAAVAVGDTTPVALFSSRASGSVGWTVRNPSDSSVLYVMLTEGTAPSNAADLIAKAAEALDPGESYEGTGRSDIPYVVFETGGSEDLWPVEYL